MNNEKRLQLSKDSEDYETWLQKYLIKNKLKLNKHSLYNFRDHCRHDRDKTDMSEQKWQAAISKMEIY